MGVEERAERVLALSASSCVRRSAAKRLEGLDHKATDSHHREAVPGRILIRDEVP